MNPRHVVRLLVTVCSGALLVAMSACGGIAESGLQGGAPEATEEAPATVQDITPAAVDPTDLVGEKQVPEEPSDCAKKSMVPIQRDELLEWEGGPGRTMRQKDPHERHRSLDLAEVRSPVDILRYGIDLQLNNPGLAQGLLVLGADTDHDGLTDTAESALGTNPLDPDSDHDGWADGPVNERRKLVLERIKANESSDYFGDDVYVIGDDVRFPHGDLDDYWDDMDDGDTRSFNTVLATRMRPFGSTAALAKVRVEGWDDDYEVFNEWTVDDLLFKFDIDLGAYQHGDKINLSNDEDDLDYDVRFRVEIEYFADPTPKADQDGDGDGIRDSMESKIARELGGITDPTRKDVLVEVDWMPGHSMRTQTKRQVVTQLYRHGMLMNVWRHQEIPNDGCVSVPDAKAIYSQYFTRQAYGAFRYVVLTNEIWNDASGVSWGDIVLIDDSTWWIDGEVLAQSGTFIHEIGHTLSLTKDTYSKIDTVAWLSYDSAMNYTYQPWMVDYSSDGAGGSSSDHDDWEDVKASWALRFSFLKVSSNEMGICD